ncbi:MAG: hypothetical protein ACRDLP_04690 [Solirubrobacteraceae bacterium]
MNVHFGYEASTNGHGSQEAAASVVRPGGRAAVTLQGRARPEMLIGAAFAGGVIAAILLRRLGR